MIQKIHLNTLLDIMIMASLEHNGLSQMTDYGGKCEGNTTMCFNIRDKQLLKKYN